MNQPCAIDLPLPSCRSPRDQTRTFAPPQPSIRSAGIRVQVSRVQQYSADRELPDAASRRRREHEVRVQAAQMQREAGAVVVRRRVAHSATRVKSVHRRPRGLSGRKVRESASATLQRLCIVGCMYEIYFCFLESESEPFVNFQPVFRCTS